MGSQLDETFVLVIIAFLVGVFWQPYQVINHDYFGQIEKAFREKRWWLPIRTTFSYIWFFMFAMIAVSGIVFFQYERGNFSSYNVLIYFTMFFSTNFFIKIWPMYFFRTKQIGFALVTSVLMVGTGIVAAVYAGIEANNRNDVLWTSMALLVPYIIWGGIATFINFRWWRIHKC